MIESVRTKNHTEPSKVHYDDQKARKRMITLTPYQPQYRQITLKRIEAFWGFHRDLVQKTQEQPPEEPDCLVIQDLESWTSNDHWLFVILQDEQDVGFVHLQRIGPIVVQLEDIFVDEPMRGQGIASQAILLAEQQAQKLPGIEAMTLQVVTRNEVALRLYHKLGYDTMSMVTLRKEFGENHRDKQAEFLGMTFQI